MRLINEQRDGDRLESKLDLLSILRSIMMYPKETPNQSEMKKLTWLVVIGLAAYLAYNYASNYYKQNFSQEMQQVKNLEKEFHRASDNYLTAMKQVAEPGVFILSDPEKAEAQIKAVREKLPALLRTLTEEKAIARAKRLEAEIQNFCRRNQIE